MIYNDKAIETVSGNPFREILYNGTRRPQLCPAGDWSLRVSMRVYAGQGTRVSTVINRRWKRAPGNSVEIGVFEKPPCFSEIHIRN